MLATDPPPIPWQVSGLLVRGALTLLAGREGEGKSLTALQLAAGVLQAAPIAGLHCASGRVVVIDAENGSSEIHRRLRGLALPCAVKETLFVYEAQGWHMTRDLPELERLLIEHRPALVILDSFRSLWPGGDENDSGEVAQALDPLRGLLRHHDAAGLLLHHMAKNGGYRGSTGIGAACELVFTLASVEGDVDGARRRLSCRKSRPAAKPDDKWVRIVSTSGRLSLDSAEPYLPDGPSRAPAKDDLRPRMIAAIERSPGLRLRDWALAVDRDPKDGTVRAVRDELEADGVVRRDDVDRYHPAAASDTPVQSDPAVGVQPHSAPATDTGDAPAQGIR